MSNKVFVNRSFACSREELFSYLIKAELLAQWFGPKDYRAGKVELAPVAGGTYRIELISPTSPSFFVEGRYLEVNEPISIRFTLSYKALKKTAPDSIVHIKLEEISDTETALSLSQSFELLPDDMENRSLAWEKMLVRLGKIIK